MVVWERHNISDKREKENAGMGESDETEYSIWIIIQLTWIGRHEIRWHSRLFSGTRVVKELQESVTSTNVPIRVTVQWAVPSRIEVREQVIHQSIQGPRASTSPHTRHGIGHPPHQETYQGSVVRALGGTRASSQPKDQPRTRRQSCTTTTNHNPRFLPRYRPQIRSQQTAHRTTEPSRAPGYWGTTRKHSTASLRYTYDTQWGSYTKHQRAGESTKTVYYKATTEPAPEIARCV